MMTEEETRWRGRVWQTRLGWHWQLLGVRCEARANYEGGPVPTRALYAEPAETGISFLPRRSKDAAVKALNRCGEKHYRILNRTYESVAGPDA